MPSLYQLVRPFIPQYVPTSQTALGWTCYSGTPTAIPANAAARLDVVRVCNVTASAVSFEAWRVPNGQSAGNSNIVVPSILIAPASQSAPWFDLGALWGTVWFTGDALFVQASTASALVIHGDGIQWIP